MFLKDKDTVLFQGDSVTDCGRDYSNPNSMGYGYANRIAGEFNMLYPELDVKFYNRGISGNRSCDLLNRWQEDCLELEPTVVCIYIGINDTWRRYDSNSITTAEQFESNYRNILNASKEKLNCRFIIIEPFVLPVLPDRDEWREDLDEKIAVCRKLSDEYHTLYLPLDSIFAKAYAKRQGTFWTSDGVHPSDAGHALITKHFLELIGAK